MALQLNPNDCARTARPSIWIFHGSNVGLLVVGVLFFIALFLVLSRLGVEWIPATVISVLPLGAITLFVGCFVNGRAPSYALDLFLQAAWRLKCGCYLAGALDRPPQLWTLHRKPAHPREFIQ